MTKIVHSLTKLFFLSILQVIMATKEAAERACKEPNPIIDGRKANVNLAILGAKPRLNSLQGMFLQCYSQFSTIIKMETSKISSDNVEIY